MDDTKFTMKIIFASILLVAGIFINLFIPTKEFFGYGSVGSYLIFCGLLMLALALLRGFILKPKKYDERMITIALKSTRLTFVIFILSAFVLMIMDGINAITISYSMFLSYFVCFILLCNVIIYKIMLKYY
jgi:L-asparagine transporter-like permease